MVFVSPSVPGARPSNASADSVRVTSFIVASDISPGAIAIVGPAGTLAQATVARAAATAQVSRNMAGMHLVTEGLGVPPLAKAPAPRNLAALAAGGACSPRAGHALRRDAGRLAERDRTGARAFAVPRAGLAPPARSRRPS